MGKRIVLTGFRGSGKSTIGKMLAKHLNLPFTDTDHLIEKEAGMSIPNIFEVMGEEEFRALESSAIRSLPEGDAVVSTGGGAVLKSENVAHLRRNSIILFLNVSPYSAFNRIQGSSRPALTMEGAEEEIKTLISQREPFYRRSADFCIDANLEKEFVFNSILSILGYNPDSLTTPPQDVIGFFEGLNMPDIVKHETIRNILEKGKVPFCAIAGNPCLHSKSPQIYSGLFDRYGVDSYYTYIEWHDIGRIIDMVRRAGMKGISVTIPFKEQIIPHLDVISRHARTIGAVNTVLNFCGSLYGTNTDWIGVREPLKDSGSERGVVFGAGGAARAAAYAMLDLGMDVTVLNRTIEKADMIAKDFGCSSGRPIDFDPDATDVVVNATPVGMENREEPLLTSESLRKGMTVFDLVYTPPLTKLLIEAQKAGCRCIPGTEMFIHQAAAQFYELFGIAVSPDEVRGVLL